MLPIRPCLHEDAVENGESIDAQIYDLRQYAKRENLRILHEYIDDGYSARTSRDAPTSRR